MELIGRHPRMLELRALAKRAGRSGLPVLVEGETGTGKEILSELLHRWSGRASGQMVVADCSALTPGTAASDLFGHARGAFTGAERHRDGLAIRAHGGTLFLDEVGELCRNHQAMLLRLVEKGVVRRIGEDDYRRVDVRVVSATNRNLGDASARGEFRRDLFFRLAGIRIRIPPLRERISDIPLLVDHFLGKHGLERNAPRVDLHALLRYPWPGNVRELEHTVVRSVLVGSCITSPDAMGDECCPSAYTHTADILPYRQARQAAEMLFRQTYFRELLTAAQGNLALAARISGIGRQYVTTCVKSAGLDPDEFRRLRAKGKGPS